MTMLSTLTETNAGPLLGKRQSAPVDVRVWAPVGKGALSINSADWTDTSGSLTEKDFDRPNEKFRDDGDYEMVGIVKFDDFTYGAELSKTVSVLFDEVGATVSCRSLR